MSIDPIGAIGSFAPVNPIGAAPALDGLTASAAPGGGDGGFTAVLNNGLERLQSVQDKADNLAVQAATGNLADVHDYTIAATEASLTTQLTVALRNKALEAFNEIMRMQA
jgi:flagellar hook-basal body complex protein FliE